VWGLWVGLSLGLIVTGGILLWAWTVKLREYLAAPGRVNAAPLSH
jgi:hypothetical protein